MEITIRLTKSEQALLLANEANDHPGWSDIARKIEQARNGTQASHDAQDYCACCVDNECECDGTRIRT